MFTVFICRQKTLKEVKVHSWYAACAIAERNNKVGQRARVWSNVVNKFVA